MTATALTALDSTVVATAVPQIVADLGGFSYFSWLFSGYLLAGTVSLPVYGKPGSTSVRRRLRPSAWPRSPWPRAAFSCSAESPCSAELPCCPAEPCPAYASPSRPRLRIPAHTIVTTVPATAHADRTSSGPVRPLPWK